jgi:hypothetical protein
MQGIRAGAGHASATLPDPHGWRQTRVDADHKRSLFLRASP